MLVFFSQRCSLPVMRTCQSSINAVESHNRLPKKQQPDILKVAMLTTYKVYMASTLEHIARLEGVSQVMEYPKVPNKSTRGSLMKTMDLQTSEDTSSKVGITYQL